MLLLGAGRKLAMIAFLSLLLGALSVTAQAQQPATLPEAPRASTPAAKDPRAFAMDPVTSSAAVPPHPFWDRTNKLLFAGVGVFRGLDYASTRNMQARGRQEILLAQDVVNNDAGFAALEAAGTATSIGLSYWLHRTGHHKLERWLSIGHIAVTGFGVARNYALKSKH
ncbi:MAG TPA: hypothetical protein VLV49_04700 [Terriglobales bacterium]|nr:hypothetical protein [Terriglobales bacterium]